MDGVQTIKAMSKPSAQPLETHKCSRTRVTSNPKDLRILCLFLHINHDSYFLHIYKSAFSPYPSFGIDAGFDRAAIFQQLAFHPCLVFALAKRCLTHVSFSSVNLLHGVNK